MKINLITRTRYRIDALKGPGRQSSVATEKKTCFCIRRDIWVAFVDSVDSIHHDDVYPFRMTHLRNYLTDFD